MTIEKINTSFGLLVDWSIRHRWGVIAIFALLLIGAFLGTKRIEMKTTFDDYFIKDDPMLVKTEEFKSIFGNDYYVAVLVRCDDVFTHKNLSLIRQLSQELMDSLSYAEKITSLTDLEFMAGNKEGIQIEQIVPEEIPTDAQALEAIRQKAFSKPYLAKKLISSDGSMTWLMVKLRPFPPAEEWTKTSSMSPDMVSGLQTERIISKPCYSSLHPNAAGMPYLSYKKTVFLKGEMSRLFLFGLLAALVVLIIITRTLRGVILPLLTTFAGLLIGMGVVGWLGLYIDMSVMMVAMILTFACSIAYNVHVYNSFKTHFVATGQRKIAVTYAIASTGYGVTLSALTTMLAMMTFLAISIAPLQAMGYVSALCLLSVLCCCIFLTPALLSFGRNRTPHPEMAKSLEGRASNSFEHFGNFVLKKHRPIIISATIITLLCGIGLYRIEPAFDIERSMGRKVPYVRNFLDLCATELGSMYSYDIMVTLPQPGQAKLPENLLRLEQLAKEVAIYPLSKRTNSILDIVKDLNCTLNEGNPTAYCVPSSPDLVAQLLLLYENAGGTESEYWLDYDYQHLRLQVELNSFNSNEAEKELIAVQNYAQKLFPDAQVAAVGNLPQFTVMQQYVERGQIWSMFLSVLVIGLVLLLVFSSWKVALVGMIPNLMPAIIVGGMMGWLDYPLDMMTASLIPMILGIAVDDTVHFINHMHIAYDECGSYDQAVKRTFRVAGLAIVMSTLVITFAYSGFIFSSATQTRNWGILADLGMISALLADLFITPLLLKYLKLFKKRNSKN